MDVVLELPNGGFRAHCKGASEIILAACDKFIASSEVVPLDDATINYLRNAVEQFASEALGTLRPAYKETGSEFSAETSVPFEGYTRIGTVGIKDPAQLALDFTADLNQG